MPVFPVHHQLLQLCSNSCPSKTLIILHYELCVLDILCIISKILGQSWTKWNTRLFAVLNRHCCLNSDNLKLFLVFIMGIIYAIFFCCYLTLISFSLGICSMQSWNRDRQEKDQQPHICTWYHSNGRKQRETEEPLDNSERGGWKKLT